MRYSPGSGVCVRCELASWQKQYACHIDFMNPRLSHKTLIINNLCLFKLFQNDSKRQPDLSLNCDESDQNDF